jgi:hypothetical protein
VQQVTLTLGYSESNNWMAPAVQSSGQSLLPFVGTKQGVNPQAKKAMGPRAGQDYFARVSKIDHTAQTHLHRIHRGGPHSLLPSGPLNQVSSSGVCLNWTAREATKMPANSLQDEIDRLKSVSARLDSLAGQHPIMEHELMSISGNILSNAVFLEVLLATRIKPG